MFDTLAIARQLAAGLLIGGLMPGCGDDDSSPSPTSPTTLNPPTGTTSGNRAPEAQGAIPPVEVMIGGEPTLVSVAFFFRDPDGDKLTYEATSSDLRPGFTPARGQVSAIYSRRDGLPRGGRGGRAMLLPGGVSRSKLVDAHSPACWTRDLIAGGGRTSNAQ